jgi:cytochrome c biogenesis protein CcdA
LYDSELMNLFAIVALGFLLGMRHATDPDHVIAVTTIVSHERSLKKAGTIGAAWGLGHTVTIVAVGAVMVLFRVMLPPRVGLVMELAVGVMLIILGLLNMKAVFGFGGRPRTVAITAATEGPASVPEHLQVHGFHAHPHDDAHEAGPVRFLDRWFGGMSGYQLIRPLLVGIVHGLAGSAAIALLVLSTIQSSRWAVVYLGVFGAGTILGMMLITLAIASAFSFGQRRFTNLQRHFRVVSGVVSIAFGLFIAYDIGIVGGLFTGQVHWVPR